MFDHLPEPELIFTVHVAYLSSQSKTCLLRSGSKKQQPSTGDGTGSTITFQLKITKSLTGHTLRMSEFTHLIIYVKVLRKC